jgi:hypothetical protein
MIQKRNLHPSLISYLNSLNLGPCPGEIKYACRDNSSGARNYKTWLYEMGVEDEDLFVGTTGPSLAYASCTAGQGDTVIVFPGWYNLSTGLNMNKRDTHIIGAGQVPQIGLYGSPAVMYTSVTTTSNGYTVLMSAEQNSLRNVSVTAYGNHANQKSALKITQSNMFLDGVTMFNFGGSTIAGTANACDLWIDTSVPGGSSSVFNNCIIGNSGTTTRTSATSSVILFGTTGGGGGGQNVFFKGCKILSKAETVTIPMVRLTANYTADRIILFEDCVFYNFWTNWTDKLNCCFDDDCTTTHSIVLKDCVGVGFDEWQDNDFAETVVSAMPAVDDGGGLAVLPTDDAATL